MGRRGSSASSLVQAGYEDDAGCVATMPVESMLVEVATPALAADLAALLRQCGYGDVEPAGRFVKIARIDPGMPRLEDIRLAALIDIWGGRHLGAAASRRR
jgi:hypothetical protein